MVETFTRKRVGQRSTLFGWFAEMIKPRASGAPCQRENACLRGGTRWGAGAGAQQLTGAQRAYSSYSSQCGPQ